MIIVIISFINLFYQIPKRLSTLTVSPNHLKCQSKPKTGSYKNGCCRKSKTETYVGGSKSQKNQTGCQGSAKIRLVISAIAKIIAPKLKNISSQPITTSLI
jgi:hypothetical protein